MLTALLQRVAPWAGFLFVILFVLGFIIVGDVPGGDDPDSEVVSFYEDSGNQARFMIAGYLVTLAGLAFVLFASAIRERLAIAEGGSTGLSQVAFAGALLFVVSLGAFVASGIAVPAGIAFQDEPVDPGVARFLGHVGFAALLIPGLFAAILFIVITAFLTLRTGVLPVWTAWLGFVVSVILIPGALFLPAVALLVWVAAMSVALLAAPRASA